MFEAAKRGEGKGGKGSGASFILPLIQKRPHARTIEWKYYSALKHIFQLLCVQQYNTYICSNAFFTNAFYGDR